MDEANMTKNKRVLAKDQKNSFESTLDIDMGQYPPKLDLREVVWEDDKNKGYYSWCRAQGLIDMNNNPIDKTTGGQTTLGNGKEEGTTVQVMKTMMDFFTKLNEKDQRDLKRQLGGEDALSKSIGDILVEKMRQDDPNKSIGGVAQLLTPFITAMTSKGNNSGGELTAIVGMFQTQMQMMMTAQTENTKMMIELLKSKQKDGEEEGDGKMSKLDEIRALLGDC